MPKKTLLFAAQELRGGTRKDSKNPKSEANPHFVAAGSEVTTADIEKLGIDKEEFESLVARGAIVERPAHVAEIDDGDGSVVGSTGSAFEGLTLDQIQKSLKDAKIDFPKDASAADLIKIAIDHQAKPAATAGAGSGAAQ